MRLPTPRGPLGRQVVAALSGPPTDVEITWPDDRTAGDDALTLWTLHELHYRGFDDVDDRWEWHPALMPVRHRLESELERRLRERFEEAKASHGTDPGDVTAADVSVVDQLEAMIADHEGPSLARFVQKRASREQVHSLLRQRSLYHLKEGDPTSWVVPRLTTRPKAALLEVQYDEYGAGEPNRLHHHLFAQGMAAAGLDAAYGRYVDEAVPEILEQNNVLSMFGLQRRLRGAALGHFAAFEATSSVPSRQLGQGLARLGFPAAMVHYYDEHIEADAVHEQVALRDICGVLVEEEPDLRDDVLLGAWSCLDLEARTATTLLTSWDAA